MKYWIFLLSIFSAGMLSLEATSAGLASGLCPICGKKSHYVELHSFSMFGEPSRDFLDSPVFSFGGLRTCPWDLFVSQSKDWKIEDQNEVARLRKRLAEKEPVILLNAEEGKFEDKIRKAEDRHPLVILRELWWMRTLQSPMEIEDEIMMTMKLFASCYGDLSPVPELREIYRRKLLELFDKAVADQKLTEESLLRYRYLHAEFLRKGGKNAEALKEFLEFDRLLGAIPGKGRERHEPLHTWTKDQILKLQLKTIDLKSLVGNLQLPLTNPFRDDEEPGEESYDRLLRHRWALEELVGRCVDGDRKASDQLWKILGREAGKLLALVETISCPSLDEFAKADPRWENWRSEMAALLNEGKFPKGAEAKVNQERNVNLLSRVARGGRPDYLVEAEGEADTPEGRLRAALSIMEKGTKTEAKKAVVKALEELRTLDWNLATKETMFDYPLQYLSKAFALSGDRYRGELETSLSKPWKDFFFKEMARLWLGEGDALAKLEATEALKAKPPYPGYGPAQMVYFYLEGRKDSAWKERCVRDLKDLKMLNDRVYSYAKAIMTPELEKVLLERHARLMADMEMKDFEEEDWDWRPGEAFDIETIWKELQLVRLSLVVSE